MRKRQEKLLGKVVGGSALDASKTELSEIGRIVEKYIKSSNNIPQKTRTNRFDSSVKLYLSQIIY